MRKTTWTDSCGKLRFATIEGAKLSAKNHERRFDTRYYVYWHSYCQNYHLTTQEQ